MTIKEYKEMLIDHILMWQSNQNFTREMLEEKTITTLERIYDTIN